MKTKNKHGFTLIELLAVIVVLAIIALIATPIVMKTIKNAKKGAAERSADSYIKQVETAVATERINGNTLEGEYTIQSDGDICPVAGCGDNNKDKVKIEVSGNKPKSGTIKIENGQVTLTSTMDIGGCDVTYDSENKKYVASEKGSTPTVEVLCKANTTKAAGLVYDGENDPSSESSYVMQEVGLLASEATGKYELGVTYTCEFGDGIQNTFFVLEDGDTTTLTDGRIAQVGEVSLIMGTNLIDRFYWCKGGCDANVAKEFLIEHTSMWTKLNQSQIAFPTAYQIALADGKDFVRNHWLEQKWLYLNKGSYWTSTESSDAVPFAVKNSGNFSSVNPEDIFGVRPVITLSKSQLG